MEVAGAVRNLHYSFLVFGPGRKPVVEFFRKEAAEAMDHAALLGEKIIALGGHPTTNAQPVKEPREHTIDALLRESIKYEEQAVRMYEGILGLVQDDTALRVLFENQVLAEQEHVEELRKYLLPEDRR